MVGDGVAMGQKKFGVLVEEAHTPGFTSHFLGFVLELWGQSERWVFIRVRKFFRSVQVCQTVQPVLVSGPLSDTYWCSSNVPSPHSSVPAMTDFADALESVKASIRNTDEQAMFDFLFSFPVESKGTSSTTCSPATSPVVSPCVEPSISNTPIVLSSDGEETSSNVTTKGDSSDERNVLFGTPPAVWLLDYDSPPTGPLRPRKRGAPLCSPSPE